MSHLYHRHPHSHSHLQEELAALQEMHFMLEKLDLFFSFISRVGMRSMQAGQVTVLRGVWGVVLSFSFRPPLIARSCFTSNCALQLFTVPRYVSRRRCNLRSPCSCTSFCFRVVAPFMARIAFMIDSASISAIFGTPHIAACLLSTAASLKRFPLP